MLQHLWGWGDPVGPRTPDLISPPLSPSTKWFDPPAKKKKRKKDKTDYILGSDFSPQNKGTREGRVDYFGGKARSALQHGIYQRLQHTLQQERL